MVQKLKEQWLLQGDTDTRYFRATMHQQHYRKHIYIIIEENGEIIREFDRVV